MEIDINQTNCDHFAIYTNMESLCCTPENNIMLYVNYSSIKKTHGQTESLKMEKDVQCKL